LADGGLDICFSISQSTPECLFVAFLFFSNKYFLHTHSLTQNNKIDDEEAFLFLFGLHEKVFLILLKEKYF
jgi:hypothetical protein